VIERLLAAERALEAGELEVADWIFGQIADADARNAIAVVGLAEVAHRRGRSDEASELIERALTIDPDDAAAERLRAVLSAAAPASEAATTVAAGQASAPDPEATQAGRSLVERLLAWFRRRP
jgi:thioredoxin-like negative regulator of GroEL